MFGMGVPELILILAIALVVIGPKKLPGLAKSMGRAMREFKKATSELKQSMEIDELDNVKNAFNEMNTDVKEVLTSSLDSDGDSIADAAPKAAPIDEESDKKEVGDAPAGEGDSEETPPGKEDDSEVKLGEVDSEEAHGGEDDSEETPPAGAGEPDVGESEASEAFEASGEAMKEESVKEPGEAGRERKDG